MEEVEVVRVRQVSIDIRLLVVAEIPWDLEMRFDIWWQELSGWEVEGDFMVAGYLQASLAEYVG